jgi:hypothetical protein
MNVREEVFSNVSEKVSCTTPVSGWAKRVAENKRKKSSFGKEK